MNPAFHAGAYARIVIAPRSNAQSHARLASDGCVGCTTASRDLFILRGAEKVDVIGHDEGRAHQARARRPSMRPAQSPPARERPGGFSGRVLTLGGACKR